MIAIKTAVHLITVPVRLYLAQFIRSLSRLMCLDRGYVTLPTANYCARSYKSVATQQSITHVIYSLYPCSILGQPKSDYISYAIHYVPTYYVSIYYFTVYYVPVY